MIDKLLPGSLTVSRPSGPGVEYIELEVRDERSRTTAICIQVPYESFAKAITGLGFQECQFSPGGPHVGKYRQNKYVPILVEDDVGGGIAEARARELVAPYEHQGWKAHLPDLTRPINQSLRRLRSRTGDAGCTRNVLFERFVDDPATPDD